jgi:hypothetical protein
MQEIQKWLRSIIQDMNIIRTSSSRLARTTALTRTISLLSATPHQLDELPPVERLVIRYIIDSWKEIVMYESGHIGRPEITEEVYSPYVFTTPIRGNGLIGRDDLFRRITSLWARRGQRNSLLIYGQRRMGKTYAIPHCQDKNRLTLRMNSAI